MWFRSRQQLKPAYTALANGKPEKAFAWLEKTLGKSNNAATQLQLAAAFVLFDDAGADLGIAALDQAARINANIANEALYKSLWFEFEAIQGSVSADSKRELRDLLTAKDTLVRFHASRALVKAGSYRSSCRVLQELDQTALPVYLQGMRLTLLGEAFTARGKDIEAKQSYQDALKHLSGIKKDLTELSIAEAYLRMSQPQKAYKHLERSSDSLSESDLIRKRYLEGVTLRHLDKLEPAFVKMHEAFSLVSAKGVVPFEILLEMARLFADVGQLDNAFKTYKRLLNSDSHERHTAVVHEYAQLLKTHERFDEARANYKKVIEMTRYPQRYSACAELAHVEYQLAHLDQAKALALYALEHGETVQSCLCLGNVALERFELEEAEVYFEKAAAESSEGGLEWLTAELLLTQALAQHSSAEAEKVILHAEKALRYLHPTDEWVFTLETYIATAKDSLTNDVRVLN